MTARPVAHLIMTNSTERLSKISVYDINLLITIKSIVYIVYKFVVAERPARNPC